MMRSSIIATCVTNGSGSVATTTTIWSCRLIRKRHSSEHDRTRNHRNKNLNAGYRPDLLRVGLTVSGIAADPEQLMHRYGREFGVEEILRCAKELKIKARCIDSDWERLGKTSLPAIALRRDGSFFILNKRHEASVLIHNPVSGKMQPLSRQEFEVSWSGTLILMTRRAGLGELARRFDVTWFLQAMHKYRRLLVEVLVASFFLQVFALVSPLFFQVVIDKVLVHRGLSTLDIIVFGLIVVAVFESLLTALRTYVFSHTTNRIDVELGARLFKHLAALPIAYFESRR